MFVLRYFAITSVIYLGLAIAIPAAIGAYYGATLWKAYRTFYSIDPNSAITWFQAELELHLLDNPYIRFIKKF